MAWNTPRVWAVGETVTAANLNTYVSDNLAELRLSYNAWTAWTPALTGYTAVTYTSRVGTYQQVGKIVTARAYLLIASITPGTAAVTINLPVSAAAATGGQLAGASRYRTNAGTNSSGVVMAAVAGGTTGSVFTHSPGGVTTLLGFTGAQPAGQVAGDSWWFTFTYEAA